MANKVRSTSTTTEDAGEGTAADTQRTEVARVVEAIETVKAEIAAIQARQRQLAADRSALSARLMSAQLREQRLRADLAAGPEALAATRAALLVASGPSSQAAVAHELTDLQQQIGEWEAELQALVGPDGSGGAVESDLARLSDLEQVETALQGELGAAHDRLGQATSDRLAQEYHAHHQRVEAARAALDAALADERGVVARMRDELAPWPELRTRALLAYQAEAVKTPRARLATAALAYFELLQDTSGQLDSWMDGDVNVLADFALEVTTISAIWGRPSWTVSQLGARIDVLRRLAKQVQP